VATGNILDIKKVAQNGMFSHKKAKYVVCREVDGSGEHPVRQSKPGSKSR
jgi:hypothetical protein